MIGTILRYCFYKWWRPMLISGITAAIFITSLKYSDSSLLQTIFFWLCLFSTAALLVSMVYQLNKKRWIPALLTLLVFGLWSSFLVFLLYTVRLFFIGIFSPFYVDMPNEDNTWKSHLEIPDNISLNDPIITAPEFGNDSVKNLKRNYVDLELYTSFQPGLYKYHFWMNRIDSGIIYLKAYEITQEYPLSVDRLPKSSAIEIHNPTDSVVRVGTSHDFIIYEGDWGDPYAARFEVWFKPADGTPERKLFEKNYKIEGWQR